MSAVAAKPVKFIGVFAIVIGIVMIIAGAGVYVFASSMLREQNMTVASVTDENPGALAGKVVAGPFTALAQANAINEHALAASGGRTYADLGADVGAATAQAMAIVGDDEELQALVSARDAAGLAEAGAPAEAVTLVEQAAKDQGLRMGTVLNGSLLQSALITSVMAFGVAVLVMGMGIMMIVIGWALNRLSPVAAVTEE